MYTRLLAEPPEKIIEDGKPNFGTFLGHPSRLDIRGVKQPFGILPLPKLITNLRIKSRLSFYFNLGDYIGCIDFFDAKIFGLADVCFWSKSTNQKFSYQTVMGPRHRFVPHELVVSAIASYRKTRYIRISWDKSNNKISVIFSLHGNNVKPDARAAFIAKLQNDIQYDMTTVLPAPTYRRCSAEYIASIPLHGSLSLFSQYNQLKTMSDADGSAVFDMSRNYYKFRTHGVYLTATGFIDEKQIALRLSIGSQDPVDKDNYNNNVLFYNGTTTPLPPVKITYPYGVMNKWNIQDMENMIDLTFTPCSENKHTISVFILRAQYHTIYGTFEGTLMTSTGEKISIHNLTGITKKYQIRL